MLAHAARAYRRHSLAEARTKATSWRAVARQLPSVTASLRPVAHDTLPFYIHHSHLCIACGGYAACVRCGATASHNMKGLAISSPCTPKWNYRRTGCNTRVKRLLRGLHPRPRKRNGEVALWPNGALNPTPKRIRFLQTPAADSTAQ